MHDSEVFELASKRECAVKFAKVVRLPESRDVRKSKFHGHHPIVAVAAAEDSKDFPRSTLKFYSLQTHDYRHVFRFKKEVLSVVTNSRLIVVVRVTTCSPRV